MPYHDLKQVLRQAVDALKNGEAVGLPTETVYGLAADALNPRAVANIFQIKNRPFFDPLIVHLHALAQVEEYTRAFPPAAQKLAERFWPGPLTMTLPKRAIIPDLVTSGLPHVALRIPAHPLALELLREFGGPLAAPSANKFGRISPTTAAAVREELGDEVRYVLDGGPCRIGIESTILHLGGSTPVLLRPGGISQEEIEELIGPVDLPQPSVKNSPLAPGMLEQHYAPLTPMQLLSREELTQLSPEFQQTRGLLGWGELPPAQFAFVKNLSPTGSTIEGSSHLFEYLRALDHLHLSEIIAIPWPEKGLGRAMNDRLRRASHR